MKLRSMIRPVLFLVAACSLLPLPLPASAEVTLTIISPAGTEEIALTESPEIVLGYSETGMTLEFKNLNLVTQCIGGDISASGLCLLKTYDADNRQQPNPSAPGTPGTPSVTEGGPGQVQLSWAAPADQGSDSITGYRVQSQTEGNSGWDVRRANTGSDATNYTVTGLTGGESYRFRVAAISAAGTGANSGLSPYITAPASEDGLTLASACINPPAIVKCDKTILPSDYYTPWGPDITQPKNKVLSMPFIVEEGSTANGAWAIKTFMSSISAAADYDFFWWVSETPNGPVLGEQTAYCSHGSKTAATLPWRQKPFAYECNLGSSNRILYFNSKLSKLVEEEDANGELVEVEKFYPYDTGDRAADYQFSGSTFNR